MPYPFPCTNGPNCPYLKRGSCKFSHPQEHFDILRQQSLRAENAVADFCNGACEDISQAHHIINALENGTTVPSPIGPISSFVQPLIAEETLQRMEVEKRATDYYTRHIQPIVQPIAAERSRLLNSHYARSPNPLLFPNTLFSEFSPAPRGELPGTQIKSLDPSQSRIHIDILNLLRSTSSHSGVCPGGQISLHDVYIRELELINIDADRNQSRVQSISHPIKYNFNFVLQNGRYPIQGTNLIKAIRDAWRSNSPLMKLRNFVLSPNFGQYLLSQSANPLAGLKPIPKPEKFDAKYLLAFPYFPLPLFIEDETDRIWAFLFHGTDDSSTNGILKEGFYRDQFPTKTGKLYGNGIYFTDEGCKAMQYTRTIDNPRFQHKRPRILFSAVCLGRCPEIKFGTGGVKDGRFTSAVALPDVGNFGGQVHTEFIVQGTYYIIFQFGLGSKMSR